MIYNTKSKETQNKRSNIKRDLEEDERDRKGDKSNFEKLKKY